jgi:hypothetical protein
MKQKSTILILSIALAVVVIVAIILYLSAQSNFNSQLQQTKLDTNSSADVFNNRFNALLQEHSLLLIGTARRANTSAAYNASLLALQNNINEVGQLLTPIYGANASQLVSLWNQKANIFINYSISVNNNDPNALVYYNAAEANYIPQVVAFWTSTQNPYPTLSQATATQLVTQNQANVKAAIDAWNAGNYPLYYQDLDTAYVQMGLYGDTIANAIIQQNPQDFP